jgi:hypothetical protein
MTKAQQKNEDTLAENLRNQIAALAKSDFSLLPLGGPDGKTPAVKNWAKKRLNLSQVLGPMYGQGSTCYGVRLDKIVVLDCDEMDPDLIKTLEDRFGRAAVAVRTARGVHLYYRDTGSRPTLRSEGLPVDVKTGASAYVVGPLSQRPDGAYYEPMRGDLSETPLTPMSTPPVASVNATPPAMVPSGNRHDHLLRKAREFVEAVETKAELLDNLRWERGENCASPAGISDTELGKIADWIWEKRLSNSLYAGRNSAFKLSRCAMDALGNSAALALYARLFDLHGHLPGKVFSLNHPAMRKAGRTDLSRERFRTARRLLETQGFLRKVRPHSPRRHGIGYQLSQPFVASETNVAPLDGPKEADEGSIVTYVDGKPSRPIATLKQDNADD